MDIDPGVVVGLAGMSLFIGWIVWMEVITRRKRRLAPPPIVPTASEPAAPASTRARTGARHGATKRR